MMENITEKNKLIAEFMEIPKCDRCGELDCGQYKFGAGMYFHPDFMPYNISWDWLMPVIYKWDNLNIPEFHQEGYVHLCEMLDNKIICYEIQPVYEQLIECLTWYNQTK